MQSLPQRRSELFPCKFKYLFRTGILMILDNLEDLQVAYEARVQKENLGGNDPDALNFLLKGRQPAVARVLAVLYELEYRKQDLLIKQDYMGAAEVRDDVQ